ncbi:MAG: nitroreductase family deazaflavin-dependent oxidoreductase [Anaerolineae bacterium]
MPPVDLTGLTGEQYLYLTTTGRVTGLPREIEIWYVFNAGRFYVLAEHFHAAQWVKNIQRQPHVRVRIAGRTFEALARVLDEERDTEAWQTTQRLGREKYGWGDGLPVEITLVAVSNVANTG